MDVIAELLSIGKFIAWHWVFWLWFRIKGSYLTLVTVLLDVSERSKTDSNYSLQGELSSSLVLPHHSVCVLA